MLVSYMDGSLTDEGRRAISVHLPRCGTCTLALRRAAPSRARTQGGPPLWSSLAPRRLIGATVVLFLATTAWHAWVTWTEPHALLVRAVGSRRLFLPRLTGGFRHARMSGAERGTPSPAGPKARGPEEDWKLLGIADSIRTGVGRPRTGVDRALLGTTHIVVGEIDSAIDLFERATTDPSTDEGHRAKLHSDLGAAYLTRALQGEHADDFPRALEHVAHAVEIDPTLREALFNKALALETLQLPHQALKAWDAFLAREEDPAWREEAGTRRLALASPPSVSPDAPELDAAAARRMLDHALESRSVEDAERAVRTSVELARDYFEGTLLSADTDAEEQLARLPVLGEAFARVTGDEVIEETATHLASSPDPVTTRRSLALFSTGRSKYLGSDWVGAARDLRLAAEQLRVMSSPLTGWAEVYVAILDLQNEQYGRSESRLNSLISTYRNSRQGGLFARASYVRSILRNFNGAWDGALRDREASEQAFDRLGDSPWAGFLAEQKGEILSRLGRTSIGWEGRLKALHSYRRFVDPSRRVLVLFVTADDCRRAGRSRAAVEFLSEAQIRATATSLPDMLAVIEFGLMTAWAPLDAEKARAHYHRSQDIVEQLRDPVIRKRTRGQLQRVAGEVASIFGAAERDILDGAIETFSKEAPGISIPSLVQRAHLAMEGSDLDGARKDLVEALSRFERAVLTDPDLRWSAARQAATAIEALIELGTREGADPYELLRLTDNHGALTLGRAPDDTTAPVRQAVQSLPSDSAAVVMMPLGSELLLWLVADNTVSARREPIDSKTLRILCAGLADDTAVAAQADQDPARRLWDVLLGPWASRLAARRHLYFVARGPFAAAPLGYLRDPAGARVLDRWNSAVVPRVRSLPKMPYRPAAIRVLVAAQQGGSRDLPHLPAVSREAQSAAARFGGQVASTTRASDVLSALRPVSAFHFGGHSLLNQELPYESSLVLSQVPGEESYLRARDIARADLRHVRLVVLAACSTGATLYEPGEERLSLAHAFLSAGAGTVLATLRPVTDAGTARVVSDFYRALDSGLSPIQALRALQQRAAQDPDASAFTILTSDQPSPG